MRMFYCFLSRYLKYTYLFVCLTIISIKSYGQTATIRYQNNVQGGATLIGNSWYYSTSAAPTTNVVADIDGDASTSMSCSADLILPAGSTIVKAYLAIEQGYANTTAFSSVKIKVPGASSYTTLSSGTSLANRVVSSTFHQMIWDITSIMPASGYVSVAGGGAGGRYTLADPTPVPDYMGGWSIIVVYSNPNSKFRNVTVADNWQYFINSTVSSNVTGVKVPGSGTVKAVVGVTGTYGDRGYSDLLNFGPTSGTLSALSDPSTGANNDALNSSIAWTSSNNVTSDGGPSISGNYTARNPISAGHIYGVSEAWDFDADIFDATGKLSPSTTPIDVTLQQASTGGDVLASGSYFISVDVAIAPVLTKTLSPTTIIDGGVAKYTWTITNTASDAVTQSGIAFTDNLPSNIKVASTPNIVITGGTGSVVTATAGSGTVSLTGLSLNAGQTATISVDITNVSGQTNASCSGTPSGFTNSFTNITVPSGVMLNASTITPQCLIVNPAVAGTIDCSKTQIYPAPIVGTPQQKTLLVTLNVTTAGCFTPLSLTGSGFSLANGISQICTTSTGIQQVAIPVNYNGSALSNVNFTIGSAGSCTADLTKSPKKAIVDMWTLDCVPTQGPSLK